MISFEVGKDKFNFRVSAIIIDKSGTRFLTNTRENIDFCVLPGGRVEMGEETPVSLKREMIEELGVDIDIVGLKAITENFFEFDNKNYHELQYLYIAKLLDDSIENNDGKFIGVEKKDIFEWKSIDDIDNVNYTPNYLKEIIKEVANGNTDIRHLIHRGNG